MVAQNLILQKGAVRIIAMYTSVRSNYLSLEIPGTIRDTTSVGIRVIEPTLTTFSPTTNLALFKIIYRSDGQISGDCLLVDGLFSRVGQRG